MNLANKFTFVRIIFTLMIIFILLFPFYQINIEFPKYMINNLIIIDLKYIIAGILFVLAAFTDFLDGYIARKYNMVTDFGKFMDQIADKILVNSVLIILAASNHISAIIPVLIIMRDTVVSSIRMITASKGKVIPAGIAGKIKTACLMMGITLILFSNLPFELWNIKVADVLLIIATVLSLISAVQYYLINREYISQKVEKVKII